MDALLKQGHGVRGVDQRLKDKDRESAKGRCSIAAFDSDLGASSQRRFGTQKGMNRSSGLFCGAGSMVKACLPGSHLDSMLM